MYFGGHRVYLNKNRTYIVASTPAETGPFFYGDIQIIFRYSVHSAVGSAKLEDYYQKPFRFFIYKGKNHIVVFTESRAKHL